MKDQIRIIIVDDHQMVRETWKMLLQQDSRFTIVAECTNGAEAIDSAQTIEHDIMLMDVNMSPINGFEATRKICKLVPTCRIIGVSINNQPTYARNMIQLGAKGYVTKNVHMDEMVRAIITVFEGRQYICEEVLKKMNK